MINDPNNNLTYYARKYRDTGLNVIPLVGKKPTLSSWKILQNNFVKGAWIDAWSERGLFQNLGIVCGKTSMRLVVIDLDGDDAIKTFYDMFPELTSTATVLTGSGHGRHLYFFDDDISTVRMTGIEVRGQGTYVVAPPSIHPDTMNRYAIKNFLDVSTFVGSIQYKSLQNVRQWIHGQRTPKRPAAPTKQRTINDKYARAALRREIYAVGSAREGNRNNQLNISAYNLGQLIAAGKLTRSDVENSLLSAAVNVGCPERASLRTIASGINAGMKQPRTRR